MREASAQRHHVESCDVLVEAVDEATHAIARIGFTEALGTKLQAVSSDLDALKARGAADGHELPAAEQVIAQCNAKLNGLNALIGSLEDREQVRQLLSDTLGPVLVGQNEKGDPEVALFEPVERLPHEAIDKSLGLVAGAGFELWVMSAKPV